MTNVLVVDDDRGTRRVLRKTLAGAGFKVATARDGADALRRLRSKRFDLMLLDVWMPRMNGLDVLTRLRGRKARPRVVVMTSDDAPETLLRSIRAQAYHYVHKPVEPHALVDLLREIGRQPADLPVIEVASARSDWVELVVPCSRRAAERIQEVMAQLDADLPDELRESVSYAFRELLLNAIEWGGKLDPKRHVRISYVRARRMLLYRISDPGPGFEIEDLPHAAISHPDDPIAHMQVREEKGLRPGGFGILMVRAKVDELIYNEKRNEVLFIKYLDQNGS